MNDPDLARPGRLRGLGGWLMVVLGVLGAAAVVATAWRADPDAPTDGADQPSAQAARDDLHSPVWSLAFSRDGGLLASCTLSGDLWLMDEVHGVRTVGRHGGPDTARSLAIAPDGRTLAIGGPGQVVRLVDASSASELGHLEPDGRDNADHVAFSPDGRYLVAGGSGGTVTIWDRGSRRRLAALAGPVGVSALGFAPDGATLAVGEVTGRVRLRAIPGGAERLVLAADPIRPGVTALAFAPDGTSLATARPMERCVRIWDPADGRLRGTIAGIPCNVRALAFAPDGALLAIARTDGGAELWGLAEGRERALVRANGCGLQSVAFAPDGRWFATGGTDGQVRHWDLARALGGR
jgi:WD40 repeat protein